MTLKLDPALSASDALAEAHRNLDNVTGEEGAMCAALAQVEARYEAFAGAVPDTPAGARRKIESVIAILQACEAGDALTPEGAAYARQHIETALDGLTRPRLTS